MRHLLGVFCFISLASPRALWGATIASAGNGAWSQIGTWSGGVVPVAGDTVTINAGDTVIVDVTTATCGGLTVNGTLSFSRVVSSSLTLVGATAFVKSGGRIDLGSEASPIPTGVRAALVLAYGNGARFGLGVFSGGTFTVRGSTKTPATFATSDISPGQSTLNVQDAPAATGWVVGDVITVGQTVLSTVNQTERRTITAIAGNTLTVSSPFSYPHVAADGTRVGDLTRNAIVMSSGTDVNVNTAYLQILAASGLTAAHAEFAYLGLNANGEFGVNFNGGTGSVSSCTIHDGYRGFQIFAQGLTLSNNLIYANYAAGVQTNTSNSSQNQLVGNDIYANGYGNLSVGVNIAANQTALISNYVYSNASHGVSLTGSSATLTGNVLCCQTSGSGVSVNGDRMTLAGNVLKNNAIFGIQVNSNYSQTLVSNYLFGNSSGAFHPASGSISQIAQSWLGYDTTNSAVPDGKEFDIPGVPVQVTLKGSHVNASAPNSLIGLSQPGSYIISYEQDYDTGSVRLSGDYLVSGSVFTMDYASALHGSAATALRVMAGSSIGVLSVDSTNDANAVSQLVSLAYRASDGLWHLAGSASGALGTLPSSGGSGSFPSGSPQFALTLSASSPQDGDRADFVLLAAAGDAGRQKKLLFGPGSSSYNGGHSKLEADATGGLHFVGSPGLPTTLGLAASGTYYTLSDAGAFTMAYASVTNADSGGLQLSGSGGVSLSSSGFDFMGVSASTLAYITATSLASNATFYGLSFGLSRDVSSYSSAYNVLVQAPDAGLSWTFQGHSGAMTGAGWASDPDRRLTWATVDATPPAAITNLTATPGALDEQVNLTWTSPGDNGSSGVMAGGSWRVFYATSAALLALGGPSQAQASFPAGRPQPGSTQSAVISGLYAGTTFYFSAWAQDAAGNLSALSNAATAQATDLIPPIPTGLAYASAPTQISLSWQAAPATDIDHYNIYVASTPPFYNQFQLAASTPTTTFLHQGLTNNATYVYRVTAVDYGDDPVRAGYLSLALESPQSNSLNGRTPDVLAPAAVADLAAAPGAAPGQAVLTWSAPGNDGAAGVLAAGSRYRVQYSTYAVSWATAAAQVELSTAGVAPGSAQSAAISVLPTGASVYFVLWTADDSGNWSGVSNVSTSLPRAFPPAVIAAAPSAGSSSAAVSSPVQLSFSAAMDPASLAGAFQLKAIRDAMGSTISQVLSGTMTISGAQLSFAAALSANTLYQVSVDSSAVDLQGNALASYAARFQTLIDHMAAAVFSDGATGAVVSLPAGGLPADGFLAASTAAVSANLALANRKLLANDGDPSRYPIAASVVDLKAYDAAGSPQTTFGSPLTVSLPYVDADDNGIVDGTSPPVKASTLSLWWLDEVNALWVRLPTSSVGTAAKKVTAQTSHFTTFALIGQSASDLSAAYAFPVPFRASLGHTKITFTGLGQNTRVRIFTIAGDLVADLRSTSVNGQLDWNVTNASGRGVVSGVYLYLLEDGSNKARGKLVVIR